MNIYISLVMGKPDLKCVVLENNKGTLGVIVFRIIPEFRILRMTFNRKAA